MTESKRIQQIFSSFQKLNLEPKTELEYTNLFTLVAAVSLSAQSTDISVNKATKELFKIADTPQKMLDLGVDRLKTYINAIGLYNNKAKHLIAMSQMVVDKFGGEVPLDFDKLNSLPGVGRKTANVVLNCWLKLPTMPVDTHVFRVAKRIGLAFGNSPEAVEKELLSIIPEKYLINAHHWLILHGRYICKARKPECRVCPVSEWCDFIRHSEACGSRQ